MKALKLSDDGIVENVALYPNEAAIPDGWEPAHDGVGPGWVSNGDGTFSPPAEDLTTAEKVSRFRAAIGDHIDRKAQENGFDSILTAVTYAEEPSVGRFQQRGRALRKWRSECWDAAEQMLAAYEAGGDEPTLDEVLAGLPTFTG